MYEVLIIGGGPAGLAAACSAWEHGARKILLVEREHRLGGILNQCIHSGFGLQRLKQDLTGPEYAAYDRQLLEKTGVEVLTDTAVISLSKNHEVALLSAASGYRTVSAKSIVLAMGCRERTRGAIDLPGTRPAGVYTAGSVQRMLNLEGLSPGRRVVILGSGDVGLIAARRLALSGSQVVACVEQRAFPGGLPRNLSLCLQDFGIPLYLSHTITDVRGKNRVEEVTLCRVGEHGKPIADSAFSLACDTLLLAVGLIPENELPRSIGAALDKKSGGLIVDAYLQTSCPGLFACGNAVSIHDLVDDVSQEGFCAGLSAARYALGEPLAPARADRAGAQRHSVPWQSAAHQYVCLLCPRNCLLQKDHDGISGGFCPRGADFVRQEEQTPMRFCSATIPVCNASVRRCPVKLDRPIPKHLLHSAVQALRDITVTAPISAGAVVLPHVCNTDASWIVSCDL